MSKLQWADHAVHEYQPGEDSERFRLRGMTIRDLDRVLQLEEKVFPSPWSREAFLNELLANEFSQAWVAIDSQNKVVAYLIAWHIVDEIHIANIAVDPHVRRQGLAEWMMKVLLDEAKERDISIAHLEVRVTNEAAIRLYKKLGFEIVGRRKNYYKEEQEDAILMSLVL